jgi:hypothetical protein
MIRIAPSLALVTAISVSPAASEGTGPDLRCTNVDRSLSERLRGILPRLSQASPDGINLVMARITAARLDCKRGRAERGLRSYADAEATLWRLEETATAGPPPPERDAASGDIATR